MRKKFILEALSIEQSNGDVEGTAISLFNLGDCAVLDGDYEYAYAEIAASREHYRQVGNPAMVAFDGLVLGSIAQFNGDLERASLNLEEALAGYRDIVDDSMIAFCLFWKGLNAFAEGCFEQVAKLSEEIGGIAEKLGNSEIKAVSLYLRARLSRLRGEVEVARLTAEEGLKTCDDIGESKMWMLVELGHLALQDGDLARAEALWNKGLEILIRLNKTPWWGFLVDGLAILAAREGQMERAARLFGTRQWRGFAHILSPVERKGREADFAAIQARLGEERFEKLREEGHALTFIQVVELVRELN